MLRPLFALFARSLREQSRTKFAFVCRTGIGLLILFIIVVNQQSFVNQAAPGQAVLMALSWVNFFVITIFGLSTFGSAITEEKEEGGLGLLLMTQLNPLSILLGKSTARMFDGLMLLAVQLPFTMLCITLGGVAQDQILRCYGILASYLFLLCNVSLLWSVVFRRTSAAVSMTAVTGVILYLLPLFFLPLLFMGRIRGVTAPWYQTLIESSVSINPGFDLTKTLIPQGGGSLPFAADSMTPSLIGGAICFALAWLLFAPCCAGTEEAVPRRTKKASGAGPRRRLTVPRPGALAVAWKDFHFLGGGWKGIVVRTLVYAAMVAAFIAWIARISGDRFKWDAIGAVLFWFGIFAFTVELALVCARLFGMERKHKTLGGLYTLPLGTGRLIWEKVLASLATFIPSVSFVLAGLAIALKSERGHFWARSDGSFVFFLLYQYLFFAVLIIYLSLRMRRAVVATAIGTIFFVNFFLGVVGLRGGQEAGPFVVGTLIFCVVIGVIAAGIPKRLEHAAAEE